MAGGRERKTTSIGGGSQTTVILLFMGTRGNEHARQKYGKTKPGCVVCVIEICQFITKTLNIYSILGGKHAKKFSIRNNNDRIHADLAAHLARDTKPSSTTTAHTIERILAMFGLDSESP